jgi:hypothetical protein
MTDAAMCIPDGVINWMRTGRLGMIECGISKTAVIDFLGSRSLIEQQIDGSVLVKAEQIDVWFENEKCVLFGMHPRYEKTTDFGSVSELFLSPALLRSEVERNLLEKEIRFEFVKQRFASYIKTEGGVWILLARDKVVLSLVRPCLDSPTGRRFLETIQEE